jgi:arylsulfatase A
MTNDRRTFLRTMAASMLSSGVAAACPASPSVRAEASSPALSRAAKPNVVLMICDDLGYGDLGCYGSGIPTPNLDRLAAEGTRCTHYNAAHPICSASRAALLTGRYAVRSHTPGALFPHAKVAMARDEQTLANLFQDAGYRTHAVGKWHLGDEPGYRPTERGFDTFLGVPWSDDMKPLPLLRDVTTLEADTDRDELTPRYTEEALKRVGEPSAQPFFLYLAYSYPHDPARGSKAFRGRSEFGDYGDSVQEIDWSVGKLLDALERSPQADNTIVIFTSDHGPWFQGSHGKTRGRKGSTFEGGVRIPFLIRWPGHIPTATTCDEWIGHLNVLPTLAAWCGLAMPRLPVDGFNASATLLTGEHAPAKPVIYFASNNGKNDVHAIRAGAWKMRIAQCDGEIYINDHTEGRTNYMLPKPELYNLERDPWESYDVAARNPEIVQQLQGELAREMRTFPEDAQASYAELQKNVANVVTPPGAAPRILTGPLPDWAWEPEDRRPS